MNKKTKLSKKGKEFFTFVECFNKWSVDCVEVDQMSARNFMEINKSIDKFIDFFKDLKAKDFFE